jgi:hypothetical protein
MQVSPDHHHAVGVRAISGGGVYLIDSAKYSTPVTFTVAAWEAAGFKREVCVLREIHVGAAKKKKRKRACKKKHPQCKSDGATQTRPSLCAGDVWC